MYPSYPVVLTEGPDCGRFWWSPSSSVVAVRHGTTNDREAPTTGAAPFEISLWTSAPPRRCAGRTVRLLGRIEPASAFECSARSATTAIKGRRALAGCSRIGPASCPTIPRTQKRPECKEEYTASARGKRNSSIVMPSTSVLHTDCRRGRRLRHTPAARFADGRRLQGDASLKSCRYPARTILSCPYSGPGIHCNLFTFFF